MPRAAGDESRRGFLPRGPRRDVSLASRGRSEANADLDPLFSRRRDRSCNRYLGSNTHTILPPEKTDDLKIPKKIPSKLKIYTLGSPYIEVNHPRIHALSKELLGQVSESATDWEKIETIYDGVLKKIDYVEGPDKGAVEALRDGKADCQGRSVVFIAICRANKIPARMVWVHGHCYPEFYLEGADGDGQWYPAESAGTRAFGEMPLARPILQKGDNFRVPERKEHLRYASDYMLGVPTPGGGRPHVKYIRDQEQVK